LVTNLDTLVGEVDAKITEWITEQSNEKASVEKSKHRYIKLEKWNMVI